LRTNADVSAPNRQVTPTPPIHLGWASGTFVYGRAMAGQHTYDKVFFDYINEGSTRSAMRVIPVLAHLTGATSVLDVGCGVGAWVRAWRDNGLEDCIGVDGDNVSESQLLVRPDRFVRRDLSKAFRLDRTFDLVCTFEVAEHIPPVFADEFVDNVVAHGDVVAFSAATPGQGGEFHVNEQPYDYWRAKFNARGYACFDALRPLIADDQQIEPWYRYNILIFANATGARRLSAGALGTRVNPLDPTPDVSPLSWRLRRAVLGALPRPVVEGLAGAAHRLALARR
jgi:SAM-dependent methyltransferase